MRILRRLLRYLMMTVAVLMVVVLLGIGYTQTGWFKDWLRRYIVREAGQYLNGELRIGKVSGSLFYGIRMSDIALVQDGETVIALKDLRVDYSAFRLVASGIVLDEIELNQPVVRARRTGDGWNLMRLVKRQARERERTGPGRPITLPSIVIHDGRVRMDRGQETGKTVGQQIGQVAGQVPTQVTEIEDLDVKAAFAYQPVRFTVDIANVSFKSSSPNVALNALSGKVAVAGDDIHIDRLFIRLPETELKVNGLVRDYKKSRQLELEVDSSKTTFREIGVLLPVVRNMAPQPSYRIKTSGPLDRLDADVNLQTRDAGTVQGKVTLMLTAQPRRILGDMQVASLNLAPWLNNPQTAGLINGRARFDLHLPDSKIGVKFGGTYHFVGPDAGAYGYVAQDVDARGKFEGARVEIAQARARAYGATVTASRGLVDGTETGGIRYEFKGRASNVDMRRVPKQFSVPALESRIDMDYDLAGRGRNLKATALMHPSVVEGANIAEGMRGHFELNNREIRYGGEGHIEQVNLRRLGRALDISTLDADRFDSRIGGNFRVDVSGRSLDTLVLTADGVVSDSTLLGTKFPEMAFTTRIDGRRLEATAKGAFEGFNPTMLIDNEHLAGTLTGTVDGKVTLPDLRESVTLQTFGFEGQVNAKDSTLFDLSLASAFFDGKLSDGRVEARQFTVDGPDVAGTAAGTMALDDAPGSTSTSDLTYRFTVPDLARLGKRLEQPFAGRAELGGKLTGNLGLLETTGTAHLEPARYGETGQAAIVDATYKVRLPDLDVENVRVESHVEASTITMPPGAPGAPQPETSQEPQASLPYTIEKLSADVTYEKREVTFNGTAIDDGRTMEAKGRALLQDGRQEMRLASASLSAAGITWRTRDNAEALIVHDGQTVAVTGLQVVNGDQQVTADGVVGVKEGTPSTLKILAENVDLAQAAMLASAVDPKMKPPDPRMAGRLSANARVTGTLQDPAVAGTFSVVGGAFRDVKYQSLGGQVSYDAKRIGVDVKLEQSPGTALTARGSLPLSLIAGGDAAKATGPEDVVDLQVQSTPIDLGLIQGLTTAVTDVTGQMQLDMRVKGRGRDVAFEGFVKVDQGAFTVAATGAQYTGLNTSLQFEPSRLVVDGLRILDDGNDPLDVKGVLGLTGTRFGTLDLTAHAKAFELLHNEMGEAEVNMDLKIGGEITAPQVSGTVAVERGRVEIDRLLRRLTAGTYATESEAFAPAAGLRESAVASIPTSTPVPNPTLPPAAATPGAAATPATPATPGTPAAQAGQPAQPGQAAAAEDVAKTAKAAGLSILNRMRADVRVSIPDNLILRGKDLRVGNASMGLGNINVTVGGDLRVMRQPGTPTIVVGSVNTVRGSYDYRGRRFDIMRDGRITFQGPRINDPALDVTAQRIIEPMGVDARIHIEGTAQRPQLRFSSNPPMDESDVIALIIFNRPLSDLESGERGAIADVAGSAVGGLIVSPLTDTIGRALNLDVLEVGTTTTDTGGTGGTVTVGKQVDDNLFFRFRQQFGSQEVSEFILEYQLARFLRIQAAAAEGEGVGRAQRSLTRRIERAGLDLLFYFSY
jgi:hypothetical protein